MSQFQLLQGDSREVLKTLADNSADSIVTDPPYHLTTGKKGGTGPASVNLESPYGRARVGTGFMGMTWDGGDVAHDASFWAECLRVAKPGAYLAAFGGSRTFHRLACAIEDAGWELRDTPLRGHTPQPEDCPWLLAWAYGSGFPKSHNGEWGGTALKPAWEPIVLARKPLIGTVEENWREHGTGALNIDGCRVGFQSEEDRASAFPGGKVTSHGAGSLAGPGAAQKASRSEFATERNNAGRWPANLIHDGSPEVLACFPSEAGAAAPVHTRNGDKFRNAYGAFAGNVDEQGSTFHGDTGSAARFFYCAKASREDRNEGCEHMAKKPLLWSSGTQNPGSFQAEGTDRSSQNFHPTVKPTDLMRWLVRLLTPAGGTVLDVFNGSGSTGKAAVLEGMSYIGIDLDRDAAGNPMGYLDISRRRIEFALRQGHQKALL